MATNYSKILGMQTNELVRRGSEPIQLGTYHMVKNTDFEPQRTNNFEFQISGLQNLIMVGGKKVPANISEVITLSVASYSAPTLSISPIDINYANNLIHFAGKPSFQSSNLTINDYIGLDVERLLMAWMNTVYNPETQEIGNAVDYKKVAYLIEYDPQGRTARQWQLNGCFPTSISLGSFDQSGNSVRTLTMDITFDNAIPLARNK